MTSQLWIVYDRHTYWFMSCGHVKILCTSDSSERSHYGTATLDLVCCVCSHKCGLGEACARCGKQFWRHKDDVPPFDVQYIKRMKEGG